MNEDDRARDEIIARLQHEWDVLYRFTGVMSCLVPNCTVCFAEPGITCRSTGTEFYLLDRARQLYAHQERITRAVHLGVADRDDVVAQFGTFPPRWVQKLGTAEDTGGRL